MASDASSSSNRCAPRTTGRAYVGNVSVQSVGENEIVVYPNPVKDRLIVLTGQQATVRNEISITDVLGKTYLLKLIQSAGDNTSVFDLSRFKNGIYFVKVVIGKTSKVFKIIKL